MIEIVDAGIASTVQDGGRPGWAHLGVPRSGFVDRRLAGLVNRLVGNPDDAALIETCGNLAIRTHAAVTIANSVERVAQSLASGVEWRLPAGHGDLWHYVAVRGGIDVAAVLGSRSTDTLSGIGPAPLRVGDRLPVGLEPATSLHADQAVASPRPRRARLTPGPRVNWFETRALALLVANPWSVSASSRVGVRLSGATIARVFGGELPSEGLVRGAIQVPPDGQPVMMLADHPTTGGYPVIAVVDPEDVAIVAQTAPGDTVSFTT